MLEGFGLLAFVVGAGIPVLIGLAALFAPEWKPENTRTWIRWIGLALIVSVCWNLFMANYVLDTGRESDARLLRLIKIVGNIDK